MTRLLLLLIGLGGLVFISALKVVETRHQTRLLVVELQGMKNQHDELEREWTRLLLEQGTWSIHGRVEQIARNRLNMTVPPPADMKHIRS